MAMAGAAYRWTGAPSAGFRRTRPARSGGHGLTFDNVGPIAAIPQVRELNIGHFLVGEALFVGLGDAVRRMREEMDAARG